MNQRIIRKVLDPWILRSKNQVTAGVQWDPGGSREAVPSPSAMAIVPTLASAHPHTPRGLGQGVSVGRASLARNEATDWGDTRGGWPQRGRCLLSCRAAGRDHPDPLNDGRNYSPGCFSMTAHS